MKLIHLSEPGLRFADAKTHIDVRAGLAQHGPYDRANGGGKIRLGLVGTHATAEGVRDWVEESAKGVSVAEKKLPELRPDFPGVSIFGIEVEFSDTATRAVSGAELRRALRSSAPLREATALFIDHARDLANKGNLDVLLIAPPEEVFFLGDSSRPPADAELDDAQDSQRVDSDGLNFHDLFKAVGLQLSAPSQLLRPLTYELKGRKTGIPSKPVQDRATRAWNLFTALYYKSGGVPWRLERSSSELSTCYVGASFFKTLDQERIATSVAQVFNERGEGLIVQGSNAKIDRSDLTPHLSVDDAYQLLADGLATYRREHRTMPARVLVHKTSYFNQEEIEGCRRAADAERVEFLDLVSVRRSNTRLFPMGQQAINRGTGLLFDASSGLVYLRGTVPFFKTYPGMYVPRALEFCRDEGDTAPTDLAREMLQLSKLNFNNTQFDGGDPLTLRAARRVGDILKHVPPEQSVQSRFRYFT